MFCFELSAPTFLFSSVLPLSLKELFVIFHLLALESLELRKKSKEPYGQRTAPVSVDAVKIGAIYGCARPLCLSSGGSWVTLANAGDPLMSLVNLWTPRLAVWCPGEPCIWPFLQITLQETEWWESQLVQLEASFVETSCILPTGTMLASSTLAIWSSLLC